MSQVRENQLETALPQTMQLVREPLARVEHMLRGQLSSDVPIIDEMVRMGGATGGKRFRPVLLLLAARANGGPENNIMDHHIALATSVEMIHAATLVHDDIIDHATTRRHVSTINSVWGNQGAVLFGDYLFTQAFYLASLTGNALACQIIGRATNRVCEGELQQSDAAGNYETSVDEYFDIISKKTAALCACATELGACFSESGQNIEKWRMVGERLGSAFQIVDDLLDFTGQDAVAGKTLGTDLETAKPTLPVLLALQECTLDDRHQWVQKLSDGAVSRSEVAEWLRSKNAIQHAFDIAAARVSQALEFTATQSQSVALAFQELGQFLLARTH